MCYGNANVNISTHIPPPAQDLLLTKQLGQADKVVLVGGTGVMGLIPEVKAMLAAHTQLFAVCDGCLLIDTPPFPASVPVQPTPVQPSSAAPYEAGRQAVRPSFAHGGKVGLVPSAPLVQEFKKGLVYWNATASLCPSVNTTGISIPTCMCVCVRSCVVVSN